MDLFTEPLRKNIVRNKQNLVVAREYQTVYKPLKEIPLGNSIHDLKVNSSSSAFEMFQKIWEGDIRLHESFYVLALNNYNRVIGYKTLSKGGLTATIVDIRLMFNFLLSFPATTFLIAHNHPSGNPRPSQADNQLTQKIKNASKLLDINFLDHLILYHRHTDDFSSYYSYADEGQL